MLQIIFKNFDRLSLCKWLVRDQAFFQEIYRQFFLKKKKSKLNSQSFVFFSGDIFNEKILGEEVSEKFLVGKRLGGVRTLNQDLRSLRVQMTKI